MRRVLVTWLRISGFITINLILWGFFVIPLEFGQPRWPILNPIGYTLLLLFIFVGGFTRLVPVKVGRGVIWLLEVAHIARHLDSNQDGEEGREPTIPEDRDREEAIAVVIAAIAAATIIFGLLLESLVGAGFSGFNTGEEVNTWKWIGFAIDNLSESVLLDTPSIYRVHLSTITAETRAAQTLIFVFRLMIDLVLLKLLSRYVSFSTR